MGIPDHLTCLLRNLYAAQEATARTGQQTGSSRKRSTSRLFSLYAEYIRQNAGLHEAQAGIKIARRNISNLRYADDSTLVAENEEELKSLLIKVKEESEKSWLKAQHSEI